MKITNVLMSTCAAAMLLTGCMTEEPIKQRVSDDRIILIDNSKFSTGLLSAKTLINDEGLLTVDANVLVSRTSPLRWIFCGDPQVTVWYHFDWIDAQGNISSPVVQREMVVLPGNILVFHGVAPAEKYINYVLTISLRGAETAEEAAKQREEVKKLYSESGKIKPAGKSEARQKSRKKKSVKPAVKKAPAEKAAAKPAAKKAPAEKAAAKPAVEKAPAKKAAEPAAKPGKLTEPFD